MEGKLLNWERQLWDLVIYGDGERCPIYDWCVYREQGQWCFSDHLYEVAQLLDGKAELDLSESSFIGTGKQKPGTPYALVEKLANKLLNIRGFQSPPVPNELAELCDETRTIEIREVPLSAYHGAIWALGDNWVIHLNSNDEPGIKRHTLFHEAFHVMAHCKGSPVFKRTGSDRINFNELLADYFAMCVLMPRDWVIEKWAECANAPKMAVLFGVSLSSMNLRLKWLHLI